MLPSLLSLCAGVFSYLIMISPPGRFIITVPTLLLGILSSQFVSGLDLVALSAILAGI